MNESGNKSGNSNQEVDAPARLVEAFGRLNREHVFIPPDADAAILNSARPHLAAIRHKQSHQPAYFKWVALAACLALLLWLIQPFSNRSNLQSREDVNHDGRVDILDAFQLAREINSGKSMPKVDDFNGDGRVDRADVELVARDAVKLDREGRL